MDILNVMWSGGAAFVSVHKVHRDILRLAGAGADIETLLLRAGDAEPLQSVGQVSSLGLSSGRIKGRGLAVVRRYLDRRRLARWIARQSPRVVLLDGVGVATYVLPLLRKLTSIRVVVLFHGGKRLKTADVTLLQGFSPERLALVAVSQTLAADLGRQIGRAVLGGRVAFDPVVFRAALMERGGARHTLGLSGQTDRIIGAVGRLVAEKGFALLIESISGWLLDNPRDHLVIVGEGGERQQLEALSRRLGVAAQVHLVGHHPQAPQLYSAFDLICIPSEQEGLGLVLPEAVISGVPVLASDLPVFREQLAGGSGLVPLGQREQWRDALRQTLEGDPEQMAEAQRVGLDAEAAWARFEGFYRQLFSR